MSKVKFDNCGGCGLLRSLVLRGDIYRCMWCLRKEAEGDFRAQEEREMSLGERP